MRKILFSIIAASVALAFMSNSSCSRNKEKKEDPTVLAARQEKFEKDSLEAAHMADSIAKAQVEEGFVIKGYSKATMIDRTGLDGCTFIIELQSGEKLIPLHLQKEFMKDKMTVWVKYKKEDAMTVCMAGQTVRVIDIRERE